jgi:hypothetical protein
MAKTTKLKYKFNAITGKFDLVSESATAKDGPISHEMNSAGYPLVVYDPASGTYLNMGPLPIFDLDGNQVIATETTPVLDVDYDGGGAGGNYEAVDLDGGNAGPNSGGTVDSGGA